MNQSYLRGDSGAVRGGSGVAREIHRASLKSAFGIAS